MKQISTHIHSPFSGFLGLKRSAFGFPGFKRSACGFTLAELLIALAILGVIATFAIPKVLHNQQDQEKKAIFRESFASISTLYQVGVLKGELTHANAITYLGQKLNAVKICPNDIFAEGCSAVYNLGPGLGGFKLHNGALLVVWNGGIIEDYSLDWNGDLPPNADGQDTLWFLGNVNYTPNYCGIRPSQVGFPDSSCSGNWGNYNETQALYNWTFTGG